MHWTPTPGSAFNCSSASFTISGPDGQPGDVRLMHVIALDADLVDEAEVEDVQVELGVLHLAQGELDLVFRDRARCGLFGCRHFRFAFVVGRFGSMRPRVQSAA